MSITNVNWITKDRLEICAWGAKKDCQRVQPQKDRACACLPGLVWKLRRAKNKQQERIKLPECWGSSSSTYSRLIWNCVCYQEIDIRGKTLLERGRYARMDQIIFKSTLLPQYTKWILHIKNRCRFAGIKAQFCHAPIYRLRHRFHELPLAKR